MKTTTIFILFSLFFCPIFSQTVNSDSLKKVVKKSTKAISINNKDIDAYIIRANAKLELGNYKEAIKDFSKAIELSPGNANAYHGRALANADLAIENNFKNPKIALDDYNKAIELNPNFALAYNHRGWYKFLIKDKEGACLDWKKALDLGSSDSIAEINTLCN